MKFVRIIVAAVIFVLAFAPALASACASACAAADLMAQTPVIAVVATQSMPGCAMHDLNQNGQDKYQHGSHNSCGMAGCHFTGSTLPAAPTPISVVDFSNVALLQLNTSAVSADLLPPIKPPA